MFKNNTLENSTIYLMRTIKIRGLYLFFVIAAVSALGSCKEEKVYENPYSGGKQALGVKFNSSATLTPAEGQEQTEVMFSAEGLLPYKDKVSVFFNGVEAQVLEVTSSGVRVKVPANASTGNSSIAIDDQVFVGPKFRILGKIRFDDEFTIKTGADQQVSEGLKLTDGRTILVGNFSNYDNKGAIVPLRGIIRMHANGNLDDTFKPNGGSAGSIASIAAANGNYFVAGSVKGFYINPGGRGFISNIDNITRLNNDGSLDSAKVVTASTAVTLKLKAVPAFNGGTNAAIRKIYNYEDRIIAIGDFKYYVSHRYDQPRKVGSTPTQPLDSVITDSVEVPQIIKFKLDGSLDKSYRFNTNTNSGFPGGNGSIYASYLHTDGKLFLGGRFTSFDNSPAPKMVRLKADGTIDPSFSVGQGTNGSVRSVYFNESTRKYLLAGQFTTFNGAPANGLVMLNENGSIDNSFVSKGFENGDPSFIKQLSNGLIFVSGSFDTYNGIRRSGIIIINQSGELVSGYNAIGDFAGSINDIIEGTNSVNQQTLLLLGNFKKFDGTLVSNVARLVIEP